MSKLKAFLDGNKTYMVALAILIAGILQTKGIEIPEYVWATLAALGLGFLRSGVKKSGPNTGG